ncbi:MAG: PLP-dependent transferase [Planctomycetaceae bacterium]
MPIYQTTSYVFRDTDEAAELFDLKLCAISTSRSATPRPPRSRSRLASLENGTGGVVLASGMAAQFAVFMTPPRTGR